MKKTETRWRGRQIGAWLLAFIMVCSLIMVPAVEVQAADINVDLNVDTSQRTATASNGVAEIRFTVPEEYNTISKLSAAGISKLQVTFKVTSVTPSGNAGAQAFLGYGEKWESGSSWQDITTGQEITTTLDLSSCISGNESIYAYGIQFANISGVITYQIISANLTGTSSGTGGSGSSTDFGTTRDCSTGVSVSLSNQGAPSSDWSAFDMDITNNAGSAISDWIVVLKVPSGTASTFKCWNATFVTDGDTIYMYPMQSGGNAVIQPGTLGSDIPGGGFSGKYVDAGNIQVQNVYYNKGTSSTYDYSTGKTNDESGGSGGGGSSATDTTTNKDLNVEYNYAKLLQESLYFYDANMCGALEGTCGLNWRGNCHTYDANVTYTKDGKNYSVDASGGFHDAGDHVKFGLPQGYTASMLGMSYYQFGAAFDDLGQKEHLKKITDYFCDYFKRCTVYDNSGKVIAFCYQVGEGNSDHAIWSAPEGQTLARPAYFADASNPATDEVGVAIAALALNYKNFNNTEDLKVAKDLFAFVQANNKAVATDGASGFYNSETWQDDYALAASALWVATGESAYQTEYNNNKSGVNQYWVLDWANSGAMASMLAGDFTTLASITNVCKQKPTIDSVFHCVDSWGSCRYSAAEQFTGLVYDKLTGSDTYTAWATGQMNYMLGDNPNKRCYIVGYNENSSQYPHHRAASRSTDAGVTREDHYTLLGALVGGPGSNGVYKDDQSDYHCNEVALDYNAGLVGAAAGLYLSHKEDSSVYLSYEKRNTDNYSTQIASQTELGKLGVSIYYGSSNPTTVNVTGVTLDKTAVGLTVGTTKKLTATVAPSDATNKKVTWKSDTPAVATVIDGTVTAVASGTAVITATTADGNYTAECTVTVTNPVTDFTLNKATLSLKKGESDTLSITSTVPISPDAYAPEWSSNKSSVAIVDSTGKVTAVAAGTADITAVINGIEKKCTVTVSVPLESVTLNQHTLTLNKGENETLTTTIAPADVTDVSYTWTSSDSKVATVANGNVTARKTGTATIIVEAGGKTDTCVVTVKTPVKGVTLNQSQLSLIKGTNDTLTATITPSDADTKTVTWTSSNSEVATVENGKVTALKSGEAMITAVVEGKQAECVVTVTNPVKSVELDKTEATLEVDSSLTLNQTILPVDADNVAVVWSSNNPAAATVDSNGTVTAVAEGTAIITVTTEHGSKKAACQVTVTKKAQAKPEVTLAQAGRTANSIAVSVSPSAGSGTAYEYSVNGAAWQSSNTITGLKEATQYIVQVRLAATEKLLASEAADSMVKISTLVEKPYVIDISKLSDRSYVEGFYTKDDGTDSVQTASYNSATNTLTLLQSDQKYTLTGANAELKVVLEVGVANTEVVLTKISCSSVEAGNITIESGNVSVNKLHSFADIEIKGGTVTAEEGIYATGNITISGEKTVVTATGEAGKAGIEAGNTIAIRGGTVIATGGSDAAGIKGDTIAITGGVITAIGTGTGAALYGESKVSLTGGTLTATAGKTKDPETSIDVKEGGTIIWDGTSVTGDTENIFSVTPVDSKGEVAIAYTVTLIDGNTDVKTVTKGQVITLKALGDKTGKKVSWKDDFGNSYQDGDKVTIKHTITFTAAYTVIQVESVKLTLAGTSLIKGQTIQATATVLPTDAANKKVVWSSSNPSVAAVNSNGVITALEEGKAEIIVTSAENSSKYDKITVVVTANATGSTDKEDEIRATGMKLFADVKGAKKIPVVGTYKLAQRKKLDLDITFLPANAEEENLTFTSSNPKIAKVNKNGRVTAGKKAGKTTITVTSENGLKKTVRVQVMKKPVKKIKIRASKKMIKVKKKLKLKAIISPGKKNASNNLYWKSSKPKIATVSSKGVVKGMKKGTVKITAVSTDGSGKKATITIKVK